MSHQNSPEICPVCKEKADFKFIQDYKNSQEEWSLYECSECQVQFWMPFKGPGAESKYYEFSPEYIVKDVERPKISRGYHKKFLKIHKDLPKEIKILDLGCGPGEFIAELKKRGHEVWGVDFSEKAIKLAKKYFGLKNLYAMPFDDFFKLPDLPKFDIITFFEVIEHLDNPLEFIQNVKNILKEDGLLVLSTPSRERILVDLIRWEYPPNHLSRWNEKAISNLFQKINFKIMNINYVEQFKFILENLSDRFRLGLVAKTAEIVKDKKVNVGGVNSVLVKLMRLGGCIKDYLLFGILATILFLIGKLTNRKNGDMLVWLHAKVNLINK